jgi:hypothetical protein
MKSYERSHKGSQSPERSLRVCQAFPIFIRHGHDEEDMKNVMTVLTGKMTMQELIEKLKEIGRSK